MGAQWKTCKNTLVFPQQVWAFGNPDNHLICSLFVTDINSKYIMEHYNSFVLLILFFNISSTLLSCNYVYYGYAGQQNKAFKMFVHIKINVWRCSESTCTQSTSSYDIYMFNEIEQSEWLNLKLRYYSLYNFNLAVPSMYIDRMLYQNVCIHLISQRIYLHT